MPIGKSVAGGGGQAIFNFKLGARGKGNTSTAQRGEPFILWLEGFSFILDVIWVRKIYLLRIN